MKCNFCESSALHKPHVSLFPEKTISVLPIFYVRSGMGKYSLPYEVKRAIFFILDTAELKTLETLSRPLEWLNPHQIHERLKGMRMGNIDRTKITNYLNECYEHEERYVDRRKPQKNEIGSETKAQNEYKLMGSGHELLEFMNDPRTDYINKRFSK